MAIAQSSATKSSASSRRNGTRAEDGAGRGNQENGMASAQEALEELEFTAQSWFRNGHEPLEPDRVQEIITLFARVEVGCVLERKLNEAAESEDRVTTYEEGDSSAIGPVIAGLSGSVMPQLAFRRLVAELFGGDETSEFVELYRRSNLEGIRVQATSVLAS